MTKDHEVRAVLLFSKAFLTPLEPCFPSPHHAKLLPDVRRFNGWWALFHWSTRGHDALQCCQTWWKWVGISGLACRRHVAWGPVACSARKASWAVPLPNLLEFLGKQSFWFSGNGWKFAVEFPFAPPLMLVEEGIFVPCDWTRKSWIPLTFGSINCRRLASTASVVVDVVGYSLGSRSRCFGILFLDAFYGSFW